MQFKNAFYPHVSAASALAFSMSIGALTGCIESTQPEETGAAVHVAVAQSADTAGAAGCSTFGQHKLGSPFEGNMACLTLSVAVDWNDDPDARQEEDFVIGTDCQLYHSWQDQHGLWHSWQPLGGCFGDLPLAPTTSSIPNLSFFNFHRNGQRSLTIAGVGMDARYWCLDWPWSNGWHHCPF